MPRSILLLTPGRSRQRRDIDARITAAELARQKAEHLRHQDCLAYHWVQALLAQLVKDGNPAAPPGAALTACEALHRAQGLSDEEELETLRAAFLKATARDN